MTKKVLGRFGLAAILLVVLEEQNRRIPMTHLLSRQKENGEIVQPQEGEGLPHIEAEAE